MNESQTTQLTRLKAYLTERLEEWEKATAGPWRIEAPLPDDTSNCTKAGCELAIQGASGPDVAWIKQYKCSDGIFNASCITNARTLAPILLTNTLREVEWLEELYYDADQCADGAPDASDHDKLCNSLCGRVSGRLNSILNTFKEVLQ